MKELAATGIFGWEGAERRSNRYGAIHMCSEPYEGPARALATHRGCLMTLLGKRVHLTVKVIESRKSTHLGDQGLRIFPIQPETGETVDLGVGYLGVEPGWDGTNDIVLRPEDGRTVFWLDPHKMYRLHDQTVEVYIEETTAPCSPAPEIEASTEQEAFDNGEGSFQLKNVAAGEEIRILPHVEDLGGGMFSFSLQPGKGVKMKVTKL